MRLSFLILKSIFDLTLTCQSEWQVGWIVFDLSQAQVMTSPVSALRIRNEYTEV